MNWNDRFIEIGKELLERGYVVRRQEDVVATERRLVKLEADNLDLRARLAEYDGLSGEIIRAIARRLPGENGLAATAGAEHYAVVDGSPVQRGRVPERRWMTVSEYADTRGYSKRLIQQWIAAGLPCIGEKKARRVVIADADEWIANRGRGRAAGG